MGHDSPFTPNKNTQSSGHDKKRWRLGPCNEKGRFPGDSLVNGRNSSAQLNPLRLDGYSTSVWRHRTPQSRRAIPTGHNGVAAAPPLAAVPVQAPAPAPAAGGEARGICRIQGSSLGDRGRGGAGGRGDPRRGQGGAGHAAVRGLQRLVHGRHRRCRARGLRARAGDHGHSPLRIRHLGGHPGQWSFAPPSPVPCVILRSTLLVQCKYEVKVITGASACVVVDFEAPCSSAPGVVPFVQIGMLKNGVVA